MDKAACYREQGKLTESFTLYEKAMEGRKNVLGLKHADMMLAINDYGLVLADLWRLESAIAIQREALLGQEKALGLNHKHTVWTRNVVAELSEKLDEV